MAILRRIVFLLIWVLYVDFASAAAESFVAPDEYLVKVGEDISVYQKPENSVLNKTHWKILKNSLLAVHRKSMTSSPGKCIENFRVLRGQVEFSDATELCLRSVDLSPRFGKTSFVICHEPGCRDRLGSEKTKLSYCGKMKQQLTAEMARLTQEIKGTCKDARPIPTKSVKKKYFKTVRGRLRCKKKKGKKRKCWRPRIKKAFYKTVEEPDLQASQKNECTKHTVYPTSYTFPDMRNYDCSGSVHFNPKRNFKATKMKDLRNPKGELIVRVCEKFAYDIFIQGAGVVLKDGQPVLVGHNGRSGKNNFFVYPPHLQKCAYGLGYAANCLLPYHSFAANSQKRCWPRDTVFYIPKLKAAGFDIPILEKRDTGAGKHFRQSCDERIDIYSVSHRTYHGVCHLGLCSGAQYSNPTPAFVLSGEIAQKAKAFIRKCYPTMYDSPREDQQD